MYLKYVLIEETVFVELKKRLVANSLSSFFPLGNRQISAVWKKHQTKDAKKKSNYMMLFLFLNQ